jgi:integral membrane protein (TIGR01906 family)
MRSTSPSVSTVAPRVSASPEVLDWLRSLVSLAFVLLLPLLIIGTSLRGLVTDRELILQGFRDNQVATTTGLDDPQLQRIADAFVVYFQAPPGQIQMQVTAFGQSRLLFNDREVAHMQDVQALIEFFLRMQIVAAAFVVIRLVLGVVYDRSPLPIGREMLWSTGLIVALVMLVGILSLIDFDSLWTTFHQIAFRNDLWELDPTRDYLIMLFPEPFWYTATIRMAATVAIETAALAVVGVGLLLSPRFLR